MAYQVLAFHFPQQTKKQVIVFQFCLCIRNNESKPREKRKIVHGKEKKKKKVKKSPFFFCCSGHMQVSRTRRVLWV